MKGWRGGDSAPSQRALLRRGVRDRNGELLGSDSPSGWSTARCWATTVLGLDRVRAKCTKVVVAVQAHLVPMLCVGVETRTPKGAEWRQIIVLPQA